MSSFFTFISGTKVAKFVTDGRYGQRIWSFFFIHFFLLDLLQLLEEFLLYLVELSELSGFRLVPFQAFSVLLRDLLS